MVSSTFSSNYGGTDFSKRYAALQFLFPLYNFKNFKIFHERFSNGLSSRRGFRVSCETKNKFISAHQVEFQFAKALLMKILASVNQIARDVICPGDRQANGTFQGLAKRIQDAQSDGEDQGFLPDKQNSLIFQLSRFFLRKELHYRSIAV